MTEAFIAGVIVLCIAFDVWIALRKGSDATISTVVLKWSARYPLIPFLAGLLAGHLFWSQN